MPRMSHSITPVETYMPPEDGRSIEQSFVLTGKNFMFDSKGPKSWFGHKELTPYPLSTDANVQSLTIQGRVYVFTADAILTWRRSYPGGWEVLYTFASALPSGFNPWSGFYLNDRVYLFHPNRGAFSAEFFGDSDQQYFRPETQFTIAGLQPENRAAAVVRGRAILVNDTAVQWSNTGTLDDLTPALGGAGYQEIAEYVQGQYLGLTSFQDGFVVWTTGGPIAAEYIGGDLVWNWYPLRTRNRPVNDHCIVELKGGGFVFLDSHGLKISGGDGQLQDFPPGFNEFLKHYVQPERGQFTPDQFWRLDYDDVRDLLYLSESANGRTYWRTFVYSYSLQKWGIMNHAHLGFARWTDDTFGFLAVNGIPMFFDESGYSFGPPNNSRGLDRLMPRTQKQQRIPSSSAVARSYTPQVELPMPSFEIGTPGWYAPGSLTPASGELKGLDSEIEIGYIRPGETRGMTSDLLEFQQMFVSNIPSSPGFSVDFRTRHKQKEFYPESVDWNSEGVITDGDLVIDYMAANGTSDLLAAVGDSLDYLNYNAAHVDFVITGVIDLATETGQQDWGGLGDGLSPHPYELYWLASMDGITFDITKPRMARFDVAGQLFTGISSGAYHRIKLVANQPGGFYHVAAAKVDINYGGKLI